MYERIKFILSGVGDFLWPLIKQFIRASAPLVQAAAISAVKYTAAKYGSKISNSEKHESAYEQIVIDLKKQGLQMGVDFTESMIDTAIAAACKQLK